MSTLSESDIERRLAALPLWKRRGDEIVRVFNCANFDGSIHFVNAVAGLANAANHHPDITISWNEVALALTSHDAGGLTSRDFDLAAAIDAIAPPGRT